MPDSITAGYIYIYVYCREPEILYYVPVHVPMFIFFSCFPVKLLMASSEGSVVV